MTPRPGAGMANARPYGRRRGTDAARPDQGVGRGWPERREDGLRQQRPDGNQPLAIRIVARASPIRLKVNLSADWYTQVTGESRHWVYQARAAYEHFAEFIRRLSLLRRRSLSNALPGRRVTGMALSPASGRSMPKRAGPTAGRVSGANCRFETRRAAMDEVVDRPVFYNRKRLHSTLGYAGPMAFEEIWRRRQQAKAA
jgi:hypothetical protein